MFNWLMNFELEKYSFLLGFFSASLIWLIIIFTKRFIPGFKLIIKNFRDRFKQNQLSVTLEAVTKDAYNRAQRNHLAGHLCPLDQILIEPDLIVPPLFHFGTEDTLIESEIASIVPYTPDFPLLSRNYAVPKIKIIEALQDGANIVVTGLPGMGKTVALANLTSQIARKDPVCGKLIGKVPIYFHVCDSDLLEKPSQSIFDVVYKSISNNLPPSLIPGLSKFIRSEFDSSNVILLIDGLDELPKVDFDHFTDFLDNFVKDFPKIQIVLTASPYYIGRLLDIGFIALTIASHSKENNKSLITKWTSLWYQSIFTAKSDQPFQVKEKLITNWSIFNLRLLSPLEITLFIWGALSGDLRGESSLSIYESQFVRVFGQDYDPEKLSEFSGEFIKRNSVFVPQSNKYSEIINPLLDAGIIRHNFSGTISFNHLDCLGFLACFEPVKLTQSPKLEEIITNPLLYVYLSFVSARDPQNTWVEELLILEKPPIYSNILVIVPWLRHAHQKCSWRNFLLKSLLQFAQNKSTPFGIRLRFLTSILFANDPSTNNLIKQLLSQSDQQMIDLTLLALGTGNDQELFLNDLINILQSKDLRKQKLSALALAVIENQNALHALAKALLSGEETLRKLVAEILAMKKGEGLDIIKDAITLDDILVRRSAIFGLARINEIWALELIQKLSYEDSQWVIRNVASQALEFLNGKNPYIPQKSKPVYENEWLIKFASQKNIGVSSQVSITPILIQGLKDNTVINILNAIGFVNSLEEDNLISETYRLLNSENHILSEKAFETCWSIFIQGKNIPMPAPFGFV
jgi:hypothetical protein